MRISTHQLHQHALESMLARQSGLAKTQQQLASGLRFESAAEDPSAAVAALRLEREIAATERFDANAEAVRAQQSAEEGALAGVTDLLHRVRELLVQGNNATLADADREALAVELDERLAELIGHANTRQPNGEYLFAGLQGDVRPFSHDGQGHFAYAGDQGQREVRIGPDVRVIANDSGDAVFRRVPVGTGYRDVFSILYDAARALETEGGDTAGIERGLAEMDGALEHILEQRARVGARLNLIEGQTESNAAYKLAAREALSNARDLDYAEAATRLQSQLLGLEAAQRSYMSIQDLTLFRFLR